MVEDAGKLYGENRESTMRHPHRYDSPCQTDTSLASGAAESDCDALAVGKRNITLPTCGTA